MPNTPADKSATTSFTPNKLAVKTSIPIMVSSIVFTAFFPNFNTADAIIAKTAGFIPNTNGSTCGNVPYFHTNRLKLLL